MTAPKTWNYARESAKRIRQCKFASQAYDYMQEIGLGDDEDELDRIHDSIRRTTVEGGADILCDILGLDKPSNEPTPPREPERVEVEEPVVVDDPEPLSEDDGTDG